MVSMGGCLVTAIYGIAVHINKNNMANSEKVSLNLTFELNWIFDCNNLATNNENAKMRMEIKNQNTYTNAPYM